MSIRKLWSVFFLCAVTSVLFTSSVSYAALPKEGRDLITGKKVSLWSHGSAASVVIFMSNECPCSKSHEETLKALSKKFAKYKFVGVHSNVDEPEEEAKQYFKNAELPFPVVQDDAASIADAFGALKTPHAFVIGSSGEILYSGGVDDSRRASSAKRNYLRLALEAISKGEKPEHSKERPVGCSIQR